MAIGVEVRADWPRWQRQARKYMKMDFAVLTAATRRTEEATDEGVHIAERNIQSLVYSAYSPEIYQRTGALGESVKKRKGGLGGVASGSIYISQAALNTNPSKPKGRWSSTSYALFVEFGTGSPGAGHFARQFWLHTLADLRNLFFDVEAPRMLEDVARAYESA